MQKEKILIVDDSEMNRAILSDMLIDRFDITEAEDGVEAIKILQNVGGSFTLVLLDIVMPRMDGFEVLTKMNQMGLIENLPVIMVSAETASSQIERAYELGATDFIIRPFDASIVYRRVNNTIMLYAKQKKLIGIVEDQIYDKMRNNSMMVDILSHIVEFRNGESGLHIRNVRTLTDFLLRRLSESKKYDITESDITAITMASALHDIGKIGIDEKILNKPGKLTDEEFALMKKHSEIGAQMIDSLQAYRNNDLVKRAYEICRWHHERFDGRGYPDGLKGDAIPISAQIVALADVYDALTSERVYKKAIPHDEAVNMIMEGKCGAFNPVLLKCFYEVSDKIRTALKQDVTDNVARQGIRSFSEAISHSKGGSASERTLKLLDYERMKFNFYAELTEEIQFEYSVPAETLKLTTWGAKKLGVDEIIVHPFKDEKLTAAFGEGWHEELQKLFDKASPTETDIRCEHQITIDGEKRWFRIIMRTTWTEDIPPQLDSVIGKAVDSNDTYNKLAQLKENAIRDPLTGLLNRAGAHEQIDKRLLNFPKYKYAFVMFDVDFFKSANDVYGHLFGDKVLVEVAERMNHSVRSSDICSRIGGDEFLIFLEYNVDIKPIIARIFNNLCCKIDNFDLTVSMGVAEMTEPGETYNDLLHKADLALYSSKQNGRAQYSYYLPEMRDVLAECGCSDIDEPCQCPVPDQPILDKTEKESK